jgi:hypothetical protein
MLLVRAPEPFDHPDWLFELKHDGFRALDDLWLLAAEEVSEHAEVLGCEGGEDRHEEAGHQAHCGCKQANVAPRFISSAGIGPQREFRTRTSCK